MSISAFQFIPHSFTRWCPYVCSLLLCLYFCFANRFICIIFLGSTLCVNTQCLFSSDLLHSMCHSLGLCKGHNFVPFYGWVIFHCMCATSFFVNTFLCQRAFRLLPCPGYFTQCCNKRWGVCIFWDYVFIWEYRGFPDGASGKKNLSASEGDIRDVGSIPASGRSAGGGLGNPLPCSCLENSDGQRSLEGPSP